MISRGVVAWGALGLLLGAVVPVPARVLAGADTVQPPEVAKVPEARGPARSPERCVSDTEARRARESAVRALAKQSEVAAQFEADWGRPIEAPPEFDPFDVALGTERRLAGLNLDYLDVSCEVYPCTVALASADRLDLGEVAGLLGIPVDQVQSSALRVDGLDFAITTATIADGGPLSPEQARWVRRTRDRHDFAATQAVVAEYSEPTDSDDSREDPRAVHDPGH